MYKDKNGIHRSSYVNVVYVTYISIIIMIIIIKIWYKSLIT